MILYNWARIYKAAEGKTSECFFIFKMLAIKHIPKNRYDPFFKYYNKDFRGGSFLINPQALICNAFRYTQKEVVAYIVLASLRSLSDYFAYKKLSLDLLHIAMKSGLYKQNRLLYIQENQLFFIYEEVTN